MLLFAPLDICNWLCKLWHCKWNQVQNELCHYLDVTMIWKRNLLKYRYNENRNKFEYILLENSETVSGKIIDTFKNYCIWQMRLFSLIEAFIKWENLYITYCENGTVDIKMKYTFYLQCPYETINPSVWEPVNIMRHVIFSTNRHSSAISWNIFIKFQVIVNETLFLLLVYLLSCIHVFWVV